MKSFVEVRPVKLEDLARISKLLNTGALVHHHLDWRLPLEWMQFQPFWVAEQAGCLRSLLALPADPPHIAWVRLFAVSEEHQKQSDWLMLFDQCLSQLPPRAQTSIAALGLSGWFNSLLITTGFIHYQNVITLSWNGTLPPFRPLPRELCLRQMLPTDLPQVQRIDELAFEAIWQNSREEIEQAYQMAGYSTVAELEGEVVGFQISTVNAHHLHLARLAVHPGLQRLSIAYRIVYHLQHYCQQQQISQVTVNTQDTNTASQNLYKKCGFYLTGDDFPVFIYL